jgi:hypothetical protein
MTQKPELRMEAYYYGFESTQCREVDLILSAIACAGKAFHHTDDWNDYASPYPPHEGETPIAWIQNAAAKAAAAFESQAARIAALQAKVAELEKERDNYKTMVMSHDLIKQAADLQAERDSLRAKFERAKEALGPFASLSVPEYVPDDALLVLTTTNGGIIDTKETVTAGAIRTAHAVLAELSADAPAQPARISARAMKDACAGVAIRVIERWQGHTGYGVPEAIEAGNAILAGIQSISLDAPAQQTPG